MAETRPSLSPNDQILTLYGAISDAPKAIRKIAPAIKCALA